MAVHRGQVKLQDWSPENQAQKEAEGLLRWFHLGLKRNQGCNASISAIVRLMTVNAKPQYQSNTTCHWHTSYGYLFNNYRALIVRNKAVVVID